jgi:hypothetical protein
MNPLLPIYGLFFCAVLIGAFAVVTRSPKQRRRALALLFLASGLNLAYSVWLIWIFRDGLYPGVPSSGLPALRNFGFRFWPVLLIVAFPLGCAGIGLHFRRNEASAERLPEA